MSLHRLTSITIGVPDVEATAAYYRDFGLADLALTVSLPPTAVSSCASHTHRSDGCCSWASGWRNPEDLDRIGSQLDKLVSAISVPRQPCRSMPPIRH